MSYTRSYSQLISGTVSGSVNYPASQNGGSTHVSLQWQEEVDVTILVDTNPLDISVQSLKRHVDVLTGAVVTTEALHVAEKANSAEAISQSVTDGFFTLIRSDITQQMAALKSRIESLLMKLNGLKDGVQRIRGQMRQDYSRISERYSRIFEDLDQETRNRVASLDQALLKACRGVSEELDRSVGKGTSAIPTIFGGENSQTQTSMLAAGIRQRMNQLLLNAKAYLSTDRQLSNDFKAILRDDLDPAASKAFIPAIYLLADTPEGVPFEDLFTPVSELSSLSGAGLQDGLCEKFRDKALFWRQMGPQPQLERYLTLMVDGIQSGQPGHDARVRETIMNLWHAHKPLTLPI